MKRCVITAVAICMAALLSSGASFAQGTTQDRALADAFERSCHLADQIMEDLADDTTIADGVEVRNLSDQTRQLVYDLVECRSALGSELVEPSELDDSVFTLKFLDDGSTTITLEIRHDWDMVWTRGASPPAPPDSRTGADR